MENIEEEDLFSNSNFDINKNTYISDFNSDSKSTQKPDLKKNNDKKLISMTVSPSSNSNPEFQPALPYKPKLDTQYNTIDYCYIPQKQSFTSSNSSDYNIFLKYNIQPLKKYSNKDDLQISTSELNSEQKEKELSETRNKYIIHQNEFLLDNSDTEEKIDEYVNSVQKEQKPKLKSTYTSIVIYDENDTVTFSNQNSITSPSGHAHEVNEEHSLEIE